MQDRIRITFDRSLETGIGQIDEQHRELFDQLDQLLLASRQGRTREEVARMVAFLGDYVVRHFSAEEQMMALAGYPAASSHRAEHAGFVKELGAFAQELTSDGPSTVFVIRVASRVTSWLREHIHRTDRDLAEHLRRRP